MLSRGIVDLDVEVGRKCNMGKQAVVALQAGTVYIPGQRNDRGPVG